MVLRKVAVSHRASYAHDVRGHVALAADEPAAHAWCV